MGRALTDRATQIAAADALLVQALAILDSLNAPQAAAHVDLGLQTLRGARTCSPELLAQDDSSDHRGTFYH
jgi:hypothetical protein